MIAGGLGSGLEVLTRCDSSCGVHITSSTVIINPKQQSSSFAERNLKILFFAINNTVKRARLTVVIDALDAYQ